MDLDLEGIQELLGVIELLFNPKNLIKKAGRGLREGFKDVGSLLE